MTKPFEWWARYENQYNHEIPPDFRKYLTAESVASSTDTFQKDVIPGTLQTPDYAAAVLRSFNSPALPGQLIRIARQVVLHLNGTYLRHLVTADVLRRPMGTYDVWREQLESIRHCPSLAILDDDAPDTSSFVVIHGDLNAVSTESFSRSSPSLIFNEDPENYRDYSGVFAELLEASLSVMETPNFIDRILEETDEY